MPNVRLSRNRVEALEPRKSPYDIRDAELKGFGLRVLPSGAKRYFIHSQHEGRRLWKTVGDADSIGLGGGPSAAQRSCLPPVRRNETPAPPEGRLFEAVAEEVFERYGRNWKPGTHEGQPELSAQHDPSLVRREEHRRHHEAGRAALVRLPAGHAGGGRPVRADSLGHHAPGRALRLPPGGQQSLHGHPPLPAQGPRAVPVRTGASPSRKPCSTATKFATSAPCGLRPPAAADRLPQERDIDAAMVRLPGGAPVPARRQDGTPDGLAVLACACPAGRAPPPGPVGFPFAAAAGAGIRHGFRELLAEGPGGGGPCRRAASRPSSYLRQHRRHAGRERHDDGAPARPQRYADHAEIRASFRPLWSARRPTPCPPFWGEG